MLVQALRRPGLRGSAHGGDVASTSTPPAPKQLLRDFLPLLSLAGVATPRVLQLRDALLDPAAEWHHTITAYGARYEAVEALLLLPNALLGAGYLSLRGDSTMPPPSTKIARALAIVGFVEQRTAAAAAAVAGS